jgi:hypothetical protein
VFNTLLKVDLLIDKFQYSNSNDHIYHYNTIIITMDDLTIKSDGDEEYIDMNINSHIDKVVHQSQSLEPKVNDINNNTSNSSNDIVVVSTLDEFRNVFEILISHNRLKFKHIYNGMISYPDEGKCYCLAEFKIESPKIHYNNTGDSKHGTMLELLFKNSSHKCGWFYVDTNNEELIGPYEFDSKRFISSGERYIRFTENMPLDGEIPYTHTQIVNSDNNHEYLIDNDDLPKWMLRDLRQSIAVARMASKINDRT